MEYSIVIPAYNEFDKISATLTQVVSFMRTFSESFEVIVVDDGSKDQTCEAVSDYRKENPEVVLVKNPHKGKGFAVRTGMMRARGDLIYTSDADLAASIPELKKLVVWIKDHDYDIVIATREGVGAKRIGEPFYRHLMGRVFNFWVQLIALPGINDSQCGFKLFKKSVAKEVFGMLDIYGENTKEIGQPYVGAWDVEVLYIARKLGYKIKEVPVVWTFVRTPRLRPINDSIHMAIDVLKVRINGLSGKYNKPASKKKI
jgi:dolichyl-phosphate beta-glucosyltransferase